MKREREHAIEKKQLATISQYRRMVMKLAWSYWKRLPEATKAWVDPEDLIEEAYIFLLKTAANQHNSNYDKRKSSMSNFTWVGVSNMFLNFTLSQQTAKRYGFSAPLEEAFDYGKRDHEIDYINATQALQRVITQASPELHSEILKWFGPRAPRLKWSFEAKQLYREFYVLAVRNGLNANDCRTLFGRPLSWT